MKKPFTMAAIGVFVLVALVHVLRLAFAWNVTIQGYTGHNYQLQYRDDLVSDTWHDVDPSVPGNNAPIDLSHPGGATAQKRFYRVAVSP